MDGETEYFVYRDYGYETEECLWSGLDPDEGRAVLVEAQEQDADGRYELAYFEADGEYVTV